MWSFIRFIFLAFFLDCSLGARILCYYNIPSISHQVVYRELTKELVKRGHELVVITTDPFFPKNGSPANVREIDVSDSYPLLRKGMEPIVTSDQTIYQEFHNIVLTAAFAAFEYQLEHPEIKQLIANKSEHFDLLILEGATRAPMFFTHRFKAPVVVFTSLMAVQYFYEALGAPVDPFYYPMIFETESRGIGGAIKSVFIDLYERYAYWSSAAHENAVGRKYFGADTPDIRELVNNFDLLFVNVNPVWDGIRPVPPSVVYLGGMHLKEPKALSKELQDYLDSCTEGAIYMSFGTNVKSSNFPSDKLEIFKKVFSQLPYCVMWKWDNDGFGMEGKPDNVRIAKWWPQSDLLNHTNVKLFITQGGLQSTEETIQREVPAIGIPFIVDQEKNVQRLTLHGIGKHFHFEDITEDNLKEAILDIIENESYRTNISRLKRLYNDQTSSPLQRATWWVEYVLRHGGAKHLHAPRLQPTYAGYSATAILTFVLAVFSIAINIFLIRRKPERKTAKTKKH